MNPIVSRNELIDIFKDVLPNDILSVLVSYHQHPIVEFIGVDKLIKKFKQLSIIPTILFNERLLMSTRPSITHNDIAFPEFNYKRRVNVWYTSMRLSSDYRLSKVYYPVNSIDLKCDIMRHGLMCEIIIKKSWTKTKMLEEFYRQT